MTNATDHTMTDPERPDPDSSDDSSGGAGRDAGEQLATPIVDRLLLVVTAVAVLAGVVLRFFPRSGLWLDEALSVNIANLPIGDIPSALRRDGHPPLFYVLLHVWSAIGGDSDWWVRAMSGVFSVLTLPVMYLAGRRVAERTGGGAPADASGSGAGGGLGAHRTGLIVLAVAAVMPFGLRYAAEARMYALVTLLAAVGYLLVDDLLSARRTGRDRVLVTVATALVAAAMLWTHYWSMWLLAAVGLLALWRAWRDEDPERRTGARLLVAALVVGGILFVPWVSALLYQSAHTGTPWGDHYGPASVVVITIVDFAGAKYGVAHLLTYLLVPLILLAALAWIQRAPRRTGAGADDVDRAESATMATAASTTAGTTGPVPTRRSMAGRGVAEVGPSSEAQQVVLTTRFLPRVRNELIILVATLAIGWGAAAASSNTFSSRYASGVYPLFLICIGVGVAVLRRPLVTAGVLAVIVLAGSMGGLGAARADRSQNGELAQHIVDDAANVSGPTVVITCPDQLGVSLQRDLDQLANDSLSLGEVIPYPTGGDPHFIDWVDYGDRNETASPEAFLSDVADRIPTDATVYLVSSTTYRTFEGQCEGLVSLLSQDRDVTQPVSMDDSGIDESADLWVFRPRA